MNPHQQIRYPQLALHQLEDTKSQLEGRGAGAAACGYLSFVAPRMAVQQCFLIFLKGDRPRCFEKEHTKEPAIYAGAMFNGSARKSDGTFKPMRKAPYPDTKCRGTVWDISNSAAERNGIKFQHPATFPQALARDLILCFSQPGDVVFDPFVGSGTTVIEAAKHGRIGRGCDISPEYVGIAQRRIADELALFAGPP